MYCSMLVLWGGNLVCLISEKKKEKRIRKKQRRKEKRKKNKTKHVGKHVVFHACRATSFYFFAACVAVRGGPFDF